MAHACNRGKPCYYCQKVGLHHSCLCAQKFSLHRQPEGQPQFRFSGGPGHQHTPNESSRFVSGEGDKVVTLPAGATSPDMLKGRSVLMTATATVFNPRNPVKMLSVRLLFDTGSTRSYILSSCAKQLELVSQGQESMTTFVFNRPTAERFVSNLFRVFVQIPGGKGDPVSLTLNETKCLTGSKPTMAVYDASRLSKKYPLADDPAKLGDHSGIDILIGADHFDDLVGSERIPLDVGLYLIDSKLGWMLRGQTDDDTSEGATEVSAISTFADALAQATMAPDVKSDFVSLGQLRVVDVDERMLGRVERGPSVFVSADVPRVLEVNEESAVNLKCEEIEARLVSVETSDVVSSLAIFTDVTTTVSQEAPSQISRMCQILRRKLQTIWSQPRLKRA